MVAPSVGKNVLEPGQVAFVDETVSDLRLADGLGGVSLLPLLQTNQNGHAKKAEAASEVVGGYSYRIVEWEAGPERGSNESPALTRSYEPETGITTWTFCRDGVRTSTVASHADRPEDITTTWYDAAGESRLSERVQDGQHTITTLFERNVRTQRQEDDGAGHITLTTYYEGGVAERKVRRSDSTTGVVVEEVYDQKGIRTYRSVADETAGFSHATEYDDKAGRERTVMTNTATGASVRTHYKGEAVTDTSFADPAANRMRTHFHQGNGVATVVSPLEGPTGYRHTVRIDAAGGRIS